MVAKCSGIFNNTAEYLVTKQLGWRFWCLNFSQDCVAVSRDIVNYSYEVDAELTESKNAVPPRAKCVNFQKSFTQNRQLKIPVL